MCPLNADTRFLTTYKLQGTQASGWSFVEAPHLVVEEWIISPMEETSDSELIKTRKEIQLRMVKP